MIHQTAAVAPVIRQTAAVVPVIHQTAAVVPVIHQTVAVVLVIHQTAAVAPVIRETAAVAPVIRETAMAAPLPCLPASQRASSYAARSGVSQAAGDPAPGRVTRTYHRDPVYSGQTEPTAADFRPTSAACTAPGQETQERLGTEPLATASCSLSPSHEPDGTHA